jgi:hypothetical protein
MTYYNINPLITISLSKRRDHAQITRQNYQTAHRLLREYDRLKDALQSAEDQCEDWLTVRYLRSRRRAVHVRLYNCLSALPSRVLVHLQKDVMERRWDDDPYWDWGWLAARINSYHRMILLDMSKAHQRDIWSMDHPMPHNNPHHKARQYEKAIPY